jgi:hypothetical protein
MNMRKRITSLFIITILSLCTLNVASASTSKTTTVDHDVYARIAAAQKPTTLTFTAPAHVKLNQLYAVYGNLTTANGTGINDARILCQSLRGDKWVTFGIGFTTGQNGSFSDHWLETGLFSKPGSCHYRVIYDGDSWYAPAVSNEAIVAVS